MLKNRTRVIAVASAGGHWEQLMLMQPTLEQYDVRYVTTDALPAEYGGVTASEILPDCSKTTPLRLLLCAGRALQVILKHRPQVVVTTGAAPGFMCILAARLIGARTLWIDSVANGDELSTGGKLAKTFAHNCWTQWEDLARAKRPHFRGRMI